VLGGRNPGDRVLLGAAAAALHAAVLTGARSVTVGADTVTVVNAVYGDISDETVEISGPVAPAAGRRLRPGRQRRRRAPSEEVTATPYGVKVLETIPSEFEEVDLNAAQRVIGGRPPASRPRRTSP
jgi:electron transfer flavoprotein alpha subunit